MEHLDNEDWQRILFALRHYRHNSEFLATIGKVTSIVERLR